METSKLMQVHGLVHLARLMGVIGLIGFIVLLVFFCNKNGNRGHLKGSVMGTYYTVTYYGNVDVDHLRPELEKQLSGIEGQLSNWDKNSWITRFNQSQDTGYFRLPNHAKKVLIIYQKLHSMTNGALDPTLGRLINVWGFGPKKTAKPPEAKAIQEAKASSGFEKIKFRDNPLGIAKKDPSLMLNVSAIAKGYAADVLAEHLESRGIKNYLVNLGGDIRAKGRPENQSFWQVSIQRPDPDARNRQAQAIIEINATGLATSGDYRRFLEDDGQRHPHILDRKTGRPVQTNLASATIIAPTSMRADGLATASLVMGLEKARKMVGKMPDVEGLFIQRIKEKKFKTFTTSGWAEYEENNGKN